MPYLVLKVDGDEVCRQELKPDEPVTIGRALECTLWLANPKLSRQHCRIWADEGKWVLRDLDSRNGTYVNGQRIDQHVLNDGDTFELDNVRVTFRDGPLVPKRAAAPVPASDQAPPDLIPPEDLLPDSAPSKPSSSVESSLFATRAVAQAKPSIRRQHVDSTLVGQKPLAFARPPAQPKVEPQAKSDGSAHPASSLDSGWLWVLVLMLVALLALGCVWWALA